MSWSLPVWSRPPGTFQLVLGYGENPPAHEDNPIGQAEAHSDGALSGPKSGSEEKEDAAGGCKIRVQLEWGAGEEEEGVVLKLQSQLMMALPYPEEEVQVRMVPQSEAHALHSEPLRSPSPSEALSGDPATQSSTDLPAPPTSTGPPVSPSSSWAFLDRLAASIGRGGTSEPVPGTVKDPPEAKENLLGGLNIGNVNKQPEGNSDTSDLSHKSSREEQSTSRDDVHSDNETFEDAPHNLPPAALDTSPGAQPGAVPGTSQAVLKVPVRTVVTKRNEQLRVILVSRTAGTGPGNEGLGVLNKIVEESELAGVEHLALTEGMLGFWTQRGPETWTGLRTLNLSGCNLSVVPPSIAQLPALEVLLLDHNKLVAPPADLGKLTALRKLSMDHNLLLSVPIELRECTSLTSLSLEHNKLVRPLLDFSSTARTLQTLRLAGNPLEFVPEILRCVRLRHVSLANVRIDGDEMLTSVDVHVEDETGATSYYFGGAKHRLSTFFQLIFRYSSCQHPLLASALARIAEDSENRAYIGRDEGAIRQLLSMALSDDTHVVQQACKALSCIAMDTALVARLVKADVLQSIWAVLGSTEPEIQVSVLQVLASVAFCSNSIAARLFTPDMLHRLKELCGGENPHKVREEALLVLGNLAFSPSNRRVMASAQGLRSLLAGIALSQDESRSSETSQPLPGTGVKNARSPPDSSPSEKSPDSGNPPLPNPPISDRPQSQPNANRPQPPPKSDRQELPPSPLEPIASVTFNDFGGAPKKSAEGSPQRVRAAAVRALAIMGENELVRKATGRRPLGSRGVKILSLDGGGMRGMATVRMLRRLEQGTGRRIHELFDLICGTSTGAMLAVALGVKKMSLDECEGIYKRLGKIVFAAADKDNEKDAASFATWREKLDLMYKSGAQNLRVVIHGAKHDATQFEGLLKDMSAFEDGRNLLIETAERGGPKVSVVSTLVSVTPAQPFVFRNYQYPPGTRESAPWAAPLTPLSPHANPGSQAAPLGGGGGGGLAATPAATPVQSRVGMGHVAYMGSCKHLVWQAIRASSAAPYYLDDFSDGNNRWQDGAVTANNPAIVAVREARLLWPDVQIDTVVSLGCASLPTKPRGKNWKHVDTGSVLVESACSVERVEEAMDTLAPLVPNLEYVRFNPVDESGAMELDETDPAQWAKLEAATQDYIDLHDAHFAAVCARLTSDQPRPERSERTTPSGKAASSAAASERTTSSEKMRSSEKMTSSGNMTSSAVWDEDQEEPPELRLPRGVFPEQTSEGGEMAKGAEANGDGARGGGRSDLTTEARGKENGVSSFDEAQIDFEEGGGEANVHSQLQEGDTGVGDSADVSPVIGRALGFSHSFAFGGPEAEGEVPLERRTGSGDSDAIDLNPAAALQQDGALSNGFESGRVGDEDSLKPVREAEFPSDGSEEAQTRESEGSKRWPSLGLRKGLLFVEAPPEDFGVWQNDAVSLSHHSTSHQPLIDAICEQNKAPREILDLRAVHTRPAKPTKPAVLTRPASSPSYTLTQPPPSDSLTKRPPGLGAGLPRVAIKREFRDEADYTSPEEDLSFPARALYHRLQNAHSVGVIHLALCRDDRGLVLDWQSDVVAIAEPGEEARAFLGRLSGGVQFASIAELCAQHRRFDVGSSVYTVIGRHTQILPDGEEVGAFIFRRSVPSVVLAAEDVRNMVGAWRDRIVVSSRFSLSPPLVEALLDGGAKAVFELALSDGPSVDSDGSQGDTDGKVTDLDGSEDASAGIEELAASTTKALQAALSAATWRGAFTPAASSAVESSKQTLTGEDEGFPEDSVMEELMAGFYSALYKEGAERTVGASISSKGRCRIICHLPSH